MTCLMMDNNKQLEAGVPGLVRKMILFFSGEELQLNENGLIAVGPSKEHLQKGNQTVDNTAGYHLSNDLPQCTSNSHQINSGSSDSNSTANGSSGHSVNGFTVSSSEQVTAEPVKSSIVARQSTRSVQKLTTTSTSPSCVDASSSVGQYSKYKSRTCKVITCSGNKEPTDSADSGLGSTASVAQSSGDELNDCHVLSSQPPSGGISITSVETVLGQDTSMGLNSGSGIIHDKQQDHCSSHSSESADCKLESNHGHNDVRPLIPRPDRAMSRSPTTTETSTVIDDNMTCDSSITTNQKDGRFYLMVMNDATEKLQTLCRQAENDLAGDLCDEICGKIRAAVGKANLLMSKKFKQFQELCDKNMTQSVDDAFQTTSEDLAGFWDMVQIQVTDVNLMFDDIERLRQSGWVDDMSHQPPESHYSRDSRSVKTRSKHTAKLSPTSTTPQKSSNSTAKARRDLMRQKLQEAKTAGRQKRNSSTDNDADIFVSIYT